MVRITCVVNDIALRDSSFRSEHGLSFWIQTPSGSVLFDTGQTEKAFRYNLCSLGFDKQNLQALALSHAHYDHTGGLEVALELFPNLQVYAAADLFTARYSYRNGTYRSIGMTLTQKELVEKVGCLHLVDEPVQILPEVWTSGAIVEHAEPMGSSSHHFIHTEDGWQADPYRDDLSLVLKTERGLVLVCGCCHAGLLNTLAHVRARFNGSIHTVVGGIHLLSAEGALLKHVVDVLQKDYAPLELFLNHCSGNYAMDEIEHALPDHVHYFPAGVSIQIL